jgi:hypothetical protein
VGGATARGVGRAQEACATPTSAMTAMSLRPDEVKHLEVMTGLLQDGFPFGTTVELERSSTVETSLNKRRENPR